MILRSKLYFDIDQLKPTFNDGIKFQTILRNLLEDLILEKADKEILFFISRNEIMIRNFLNQFREDGINEEQVQLFNMVKKDVLSFLNKSKGLDDLI
jgi:hypothetical protein